MCEVRGVDGRPEPVLAGQGVWRRRADLLDQSAVEGVELGVSLLDDEGAQWQAEANVVQGIRLRRAFIRNAR